MTRTTDLLDQLPVQQDWCLSLALPLWALSHNSRPAGEGRFFSHVLVTSLTYTWSYITVKNSRIHTHTRLLVTACTVVRHAFFFLKGLSRPTILRLRCKSGTMLILIRSISKGNILCIIYIQVPRSHSQQTVWLPPSLVDWQRPVAEWVKSI